MGGVMQANLTGGTPGGVTPVQFASGPPDASGGVVPAQFANSSPVGAMFPAQRTQVYFGSPVRMKIYWFTQGADGKPNYSTTPLETPGRYNFAQAAIYRLKLTNIPGRPALELYPTLEVVPTSPRTNEFLAHNSVPVDFTEEDFKQVVDRNYIVKVIYLPDPQNQDGAGAGPGEISSTQLQPGQDPIQEALRLGSILLVVRIGNIDQGLQHTPPMTAPGPGGPPAYMKPPGQGVMPFMQVPFHLPPITPGGMVPPPHLPGDGMPNVGPSPMPPLNVPAPKEEKAEPKKDPNRLDLPPLPPPGTKPGEELKQPGKGVGLPPFEPLPLPPPPGLKPDDSKLPPVAPIPLSAPKSDTPKASPLGQNNGAPDKSIPSVVPASSSKQTTPKIPDAPPLPAINVPGVPTMIDPLNPEQPPLPAIPGLPSGEKK
jgi:hypothetical protein